MYTQFTIVMTVSRGKETLCAEMREQRDMVFAALEGTRVANVKGETFARARPSLFPCK